MPVSLHVVHVHGISPPPLFRGGGPKNFNPKEEGGPKINGGPENLGVKFTFINTIPTYTVDLVRIFLLGLDFKDFWCILEAQISKFSSTKVKVP